MENSTVPFARYKGMISNLANKMSYSEPDLYDDLVSAGTIAVYEAWSKFDDSKGATFNTFAHFFIKNRMVDELRLNKCWFGKRRGLVIDYIDEGDNYVSLDKSAYEVYEDSQKIEQLREAYVFLSPKQQEVISKILEGYTQLEISKMLKVTDSRISQLYGDAVNILKEQILGEGEMRHDREKIEKLYALHDGGTSARKIAKELEMPISTVSYYIRMHMKEKKPADDVFDATQVQWKQEQKVEESEFWSGLNKGKIFTKKEDSMDGKVEDNTKCCREKYWSELTDSEKMERMHLEVKRLQLREQEMMHIIALLRLHSHGTSGQILVPLMDEVNNSYRFSDLEKSYF